MSVTMEYIARMANVSKATVSRVVNDKDEGVSEETRARIKKLIEEYGYTPNMVARGMATSRSRTIGLVIPDITNPYFTEMVQSVDLHLQSRGYTVMLCSTNSNPASERKSIQTLLAKRVDGIILTTVQQERQPGGETPVKLDVPCVLIDRKSNIIDYDVGIFVDNEYAFYRATSLLIEHGDRRIAFLKGPDEVSSSKERFRGYQSALKQYGIPLDEALLVPGNFDLESGYNGVMALHRSGTPFAGIVSSNDMMALGALQALRELGISVPGQVEVIGCDNIIFCDISSPSLSTIRRPFGEIGKKAAEVMLDLIAGNKVKKQNIQFDADLILRDSTRRD